MKTLVNRADRLTDNRRWIPEARAVRIDSNSYRPIRANLQNCDPKWSKV